MTATRKLQFSLPIVCSVLLFFNLKKCIQYKTKEIIAVQQTVYFQCTNTTRTYLKDFQGAQSLVQIWRPLDVRVQVEQRPRLRAGYLAGQLVQQVGVPRRRRLIDGHRRDAAVILALGHQRDALRQHLQGVLVEDGVPLVAELEAAARGLFGVVGAPHQVEDLGMVLFGCADDDEGMFFLEDVVEEGIEKRLELIINYISELRE